MLSPLVNAFLYKPKRSGEYPDLFGLYQ